MTLRGDACRLHTSGLDKPAQQAEETALLAVLQLRPCASVMGYMVFLSGTRLRDRALNLRTRASDCTPEIAIRSLIIIGGYRNTSKVGWHL
jgi:hypothetical protein